MQLGFGKANRVLQADFNPDASVFISTASGTNFRPTPRVSAKPRTSFHPSLELGLAMQRLQAELKSAQKKREAAQRGHLPFNGQQPISAPSTHL
jgi:hypothetical protein